MKIVQDFGFEVAKHSLPHPSPTHSRPKWKLVKIVHDCGFELAKNTPPPSPTKWKVEIIGQHFGFQVTKNTPLPFRKWKLVKIVQDFIMNVLIVSEITFWNYLFFYKFLKVTLGIILITSQFQKVIWKLLK